MKITLPAKIEYKIELISNFYGSIYLASKYIGRSEKITLILRYWQHGWISKSRQHHPWVVASEPIDNKRALILVARKDEEVFLNKSGYKSKAIGLPYCYTPEKKYPRIEKSLLVMPAHGTHDVLIQVTDEYNKFVQYVASQKTSFKNIVICMHQEDLKLGYDEIWRSKGFQVIEGASINNKNALIRMRALFSQFEVIMTDSIGSHVVYAAATGAKISMRKPIGWKYNIEKNSFYKNNRERLGPNQDDSFGAKTSYIDYDFLFCDPIDAKTHIEWGKEQIGFENKLSPKELKKVLGWEHPRREYELLMYNGERVINKIKRMASSFISTGNS